jgi:alkylation response protein AidB-like acyl-CoA dehydrogenase
MDLKPTPQEEQFRTELRAWLHENMPTPFEGDTSTPEGAKAEFEYLKAWQRKVFEGGWAGISWPKEYGGRGAGLIEQAIFQEEFALAGAPTLVNALGLAIIGPTIIAEGTEEQKQRFVSKILSCEEVWCQGFSEPNAGSDVAALGTKAVLDGDHYVVNGQKIWTTLAHVSEWCLLLTRTDFDAPKHKGITAFLVDMKTPGVEVRPLRQITGEAEFNEVYFTNARIPVGNMLGELNKGWGIAITTLMNERANLGGSMYISFKKQFETLVERSREISNNGKIVAKDPVARQKMAQAYLDLEVFRHNANRALSKMTKSKVPGPEGSILKIYWSELNQRFQQTAQEVLGPVAQQKDFDNGDWIYGYLRCRANTIEAGTSEILRNLVAERVLGLPKSY